MKIYVIKYFKVMFIIWTDLFNFPLFWDIGICSNFSL